MTYKFCGDARFAVKLFFKRENAQGLHKSTADHSDAPRAPGPKLRTDVVHILDAKRFQFAGESQVKPGKIRENRQRWTPPPRLIHQAAHGAYQRWQVADYFRDS